jgi:hypothetical protein
MGIRWALLGAAILALTSCAAGNSDTDRDAATIAGKIGYPRHRSAASSARVALGFPSTSVLEMRDFDLPDPQAKMVSLVIRIHHDEVTDGFIDKPAITACYRMNFNYYGVMGGASRATCPGNAAAILPPPQPIWETPGSFDDVLRKVLTDLAVDVDRDEVRNALVWAEVTPEKIDPKHEEDPPDPQIDYAVKGKSVGVAYLGANGQCLMGSRTENVVVWRLPSIQVPACTAQSAMDRVGAPR